MSDAERDAPIRVAFVITELNVGGAEKCLVNLATGLDRDHFAPIVYSLGPRPQTGQLQLVDRLETARIPVRFLDCQSAWQLPLAIKSLRSAFAEDLPEVVQTFLFHANVVGCWAAGKNAVVIGGMRVADPRRGRMWLEKWALRRAAKVVCVSQSVGDFAARTGTCPADRISVVPNGIVPEIYAEAGSADLSAWDIRANQRVILFVGRLELQKGIDWLVRNARSILPPDDETQLVVVGDGHLRQRLEEEAAALPIRERIHFLGWRADIPALLKRASLLVLPSRWEGMPNAVLEAMAAGVPVVATRTDGIEELLGSGSNQIVEFGDLAGLAAAIKALIDDPASSKRVAQANQARVAGHFSLSSMIARYAQLYRTLLNSTPSKKNDF